MTFYEQMVPLLSNLLEIGETLKAPICGTLLQKKRNYTFGYLGLSENAILVSLLQGDSKKLKGTNRIPFIYRYFPISSLPSLYPIVIQLNCITIEKHSQEDFLFS